MYQATVASVMTAPVITAGLRTPFKEVVATLAGKRISAVAVVDEQGRPVGVVSEADAVTKQEFHGGADPLPWWASRRRRARRHKATGLIAADVMTAPVVTIGPREHVAVAARLLAEARLRRLFVIDQAGRLVGVVSRRDVLSVFLRDDEQLRADVEEQVLRKGMWLVPGTVTVRVADGVVTLEGVLEHSSSAAVAGWLTLAVPGVVSVRNKLRYRIDDTPIVK